MTNEESKKTCFVIAPIGEDGTDTRERSDLVLKHIIEPAVESYGYKAVRADNIDRPGMITTQVIQHVLDAPLVIADLTERNPNVFYELAIRHITKKPFIQIIQEGEGIPFDVSDTRTIRVDHNHLGRAAEATEKIKAQIESLEADPNDLETPISISIDLQSLRQSDEPQDRLLVDSVSAVMRSELSNLLEYFSNREGVNRHEVQALIEEKISSTRGFRGRSGVSYTHELRNVAHRRGDKYSFLLVLSLFRDNVPWLYELGMEAYRKIEDDDLVEAREIFEEIERLVDLLSESLPRHLVAATDDLRILFRHSRAQAP